MSKLFRLNSRHFYVAHSYMGINFTYDSPCWMIYAFDTKKQRDEWYNQNKYSDQGNVVAKVVSGSLARHIAPDLRKMTPDAHEIWRVIHL